MTKIILSANTDWYLYNFRLALATTVRAMGAEVVMLSPKGPYVAEILNAGFRWERIGLARSSANPLSEIRTITSYADFFRRERPDLVHSFTVKPVILGSLAVRGVGIPSVVNSVAGLGYLFVNPSRRARVLRTIVTPLYRFALSTPGSRAIFHNAQDRSFFVRRGIVDANHSLVISGSGVDPEEFQPHDEPPGDPVVLMASRMLWDKGVGELVEAARELQSRKVSAVFMLAGEPDKGYPASIPEATLHSWQEEGVVHWVGHRDDMPELMRQAHIVALPSHGEGLPRVLLEAGASGRPVVASDIPGCRAVVQDGITGLLIPPRDPSALADALEKLIVAPELRARMGAAGRALVVQKFTQERINQQIVAVYRELLGDRIG